jgi:hypothetical protein
MPITPFTRPASRKVQPIKIHALIVMSGKYERRGRRTMRKVPR